MSTISVPLLARVPARNAIWTLAAKEGWRLLRHPAVPIGFALTLLAHVTSLGGDPSWPTQRHFEITGQTWAFLPVCVAIAAGWSLTRESGEETWFPGMPTDPVQRTVARLLALLWPTSLTAVVVLGVWTSVALSGGVLTGDALAPSEAEGLARGVGAQHLVPDLLTMACTPAAVLMVGAGAFALASWSRLAGTVIASFVALVTCAVLWVFEPIFWIMPFVKGGFEVDVPASPDLSAVAPGSILLRPTEYQSSWATYEIVPGVSGAHLVFLVALTGLWGALALHLAGRTELPNDRRARRVRALARGSAVVVAGAVAAQILLSPS